ncbi:FkbM family methyltransferase [Streptomonospora nanhaiensis]|uniref:FkbM family methyltransferase n=1 Tax=Streptomonospora nanhaiensis TaxID=1323731 RepID=A0A853BQ43_9ACTN|nr:FkbM family methyltransferase [Streptomonospora nanhaiensis]MBV2362840.1 FkbM family methyltransferase [Streptomonospora nanhaiensis]MBX9387009.1 FkbM family methyltransferase [Streptomonospora nanhaiensis]NYI97799.1 FkbM family methyltransferase [Streptomonospora nanhaiensis]
MSAFVRRYPAVRYATRQIRIRLPQRLGGLDPAHVPPRVRHFELALPARSGWAGGGPAALAVTAPGDLRVPRRLHHGGLAGYEPEATACFLALLEHARPGSVLDIGANVGLYAALAAARGRRRVFAFEPTPQTAATARAIAADNGLDVEVVQLALSNHSGTAALRLSAAADTANSLACGPGPQIGRIPVTVDTLSHWRERTGAHPAVVKVDTAATEPDVIAGGLEVLRRCRPWILCEVRPHNGVEQRLMALLEPFGYRWYHLSGEPPYTPSPMIGGAGAAHRDRMWLFAPEAVPERVWRLARAWRAAFAGR